MLVRLLYASRASGKVTDDIVSSIFEQSKRNNREAGITGVLCLCHDEIFLQALEGGRTEINQLYCRVVRDDRHSEVTLLDYAEIAERRFSGWRMGRVNLDKVNAGIVLKYSEKPRLDPFQISGATALRLLEDLVRTANIVGAG